MKKSYLISLSLLTIIALSACAKNNHYVPYENFYASGEDNGFIADNYYKLSEFLDYSYIVNGEEQTITNFYQLLKNKNYHQALPSLGEQKLLVIPVDFDDYPATNLGSKEETLNNIKKAFFGNDKNNQFESVASFYNKSSYGKLSLTGFVSDWYRSKYRVSELNRQTNRASIIKNIYHDALNWYEEKYGNLVDFYIAGNSDNGVPVYLVYSAPLSEGEQAKDSVFWAYSVNQEALFSWSSYHLLNPDLFGRVDAHTFIHEVGHLFGLEDYYNLNGESYNPTGGADMMDNSLGDHSSFSKMLLGWITPLVITDSTAIKIRPFTNTGDVILLKDDWNQTPFDEYLLIEFYSPNYLNSLDARRTNDALMSQIGIKVYHVDARLGFISNNTLLPFKYVADNTYPLSTYRIYFAHDNTYTLGDSFSENLLLHLLESNGQNTFLDGYKANNETLFTLGDSFGINTFNDFHFNDGSACQYNFVITALNNTEATIEINKLV